MPLKPFKGPVDYDRADLTHARRLQAEFLNEDILTPEQGLLAARLAIGLCDGGAAAIPEEALEAIRTFLDPEFPGEPLSFHLHRHTHLGWLGSHHPPIDCRGWLPHQGRFALDGVILALDQTMSRGQREALDDALAAPVAYNFWALNFAKLEDELDRMPNAREIYDGLLGLVLRLHGAGQLTHEYSAVVASFARLAERRPCALIHKLCLQTDTVPDRLEVEGRPIVGVSALFMYSLDLDDIDIDVLSAGLKRHPALRASLARALTAHGLVHLAPLPPHARRCLLATGPEVLTAALSHTNFAGASWLEGATELLPLVGEMTWDDAGIAARIRTLLWVDPSGCHEELDRQLSTVETPPQFAPEILEHAVGRSVLDWVRRHPYLLCADAWQSARLRGVASLAAEVVQDLLSRSGSAVADLLQAVAHDPTLVPLARALLGRWSGRPGDLCLYLRDDPAGQLAAIALAAPTNVCAGPDAFWTLHDAGPDAFVNGLARVVYVSGPQLLALWNGIDRVERSLPDGLLLSLFVRSAPFGTHEDSPFALSSVLTATDVSIGIDQIERSSVEELRSLWHLHRERLVPTPIELLLAAFGAVSDAKAGDLYLTLARLDTQPELVRRHAVRPIRALRAKARAVLGADVRPPIPKLALSDVGELADALLERLCADWAGAPGFTPLLLAGAQARQAAKLNASLADVAVFVRTAGLLDREAILAKVRRLAPSLDADKVADRAGDELLPHAVRAALSALVAGVQRWDDKGAAHVIGAVTAGPWSESPASLARAILAVLKEHTEAGATGVVWSRGLIYALGKLREPVGGKVPTVLKAIATNETLPEAVREVARDQEPLFDRKNMAIQLKYTPAQRVMQAMASLKNAAVRADGPGPVEVVRR